MKKNFEESGECNKKGFTTNDLKNVCIAGAWVAIGYSIYNLCAHATECYQELTDAGIDMMYQLPKEVK